MSASIKHPAIRYHGGKFRLAPWIIEQMPDHVCYVEPFGGAAGVLLQKPRSYAEVYNDLDSEVVNLFRVLRDPELNQRLQGVIIENRDALAVMRSHDAETTLHYIDPPYMPETRSKGHRYYRHEMTVEGHEQLLAVAGTLTGMVMISGYDCEVYNDMLTDWKKTEKASRISSGRGTGIKTECLWINPTAQQKQERAA